MTREVKRTRARATCAARTGEVTGPLVSASTLLTVREITSKSDRVRGDVSLHVESDGTGPTIVLMHGFGGSARNFRPQVRALRDQYRVITFDARGHARSAATDEKGGYGRDSFLLDVDRVLDEAGGDEVFLGGLSMGAGIALSYALAHPDRLRGLVLAAFPPATESTRRWAEQFADRIDAVGLEDAGARFVWGGERFDPGAQRLIRQGFLEHRPSALSAILREVLARQPSVAELESDLRGLALPTLVLVGSEDASSLPVCQQLAAALPAARLVEIPGAGHLVNLAKPESFNAALLDFLRATSGRGTERT